MPYTNCKVHMEFIDTSAVADGTVESEQNADIGNLLLLKEEQTYPSYALTDLNSFLLDGSRDILTEGAEVPFVSDAVSGEDCTFAVNPVLTVAFTTKHTSAGITLYFIEDYPTEIKVSWYDIEGALLIAETYCPDKLQYFCKKQVENYGKVEIAFVRTRLPGQRIQCRYIKYGTEIDWTESEIQSASLTEEVDVTSATIPINTADISIVDEDNEFELSNQDGVWKSIQKSQKLTITEQLQSKDVTCGVLFIDTWTSNGNIVSFSLIDRLGLIDKTKFYGGQIYENVVAGVIIDSIMLSAGVEDYTVAGEVAAIVLTGHIPICTHREALQQVVFACGAVADCSRTGGIKIYMPDRYADSTIGTDRKFTGTTIEMDEYVSGISITYNKYKAKEEATEIYNDILYTGDTLVEFSEPYMDISVSAGEILEIGANFAKIRTTEDAVCVIAGKPYETKEITYTAHVDMIDAGEEENILSFSGCTLFNAQRVKEVAERLLNYCQLRQIVNMRYLIDAEKTGDWVNIMDSKGNMVTSGITSQTIDLTGGFIAQATCRGYSKVTVSHDYTGEFYAGERGII